MKQNLLEHVIADIEAQTAIILYSCTFFLQMLCSILLYRIVVLHVGYISLFAIL